MPCTRSLLVIHFKYSSVYMSIPNSLSHFLINLTLLFKVTLYYLGGQKSHALLAFPSREEYFFKRTVGDRRSVSFESQVIDVLVSLARSLVFKREKPSQVLSYYWFRAPFGVGGATGDASTKDRDPTTAFGFHYRLQITPRSMGHLG